MIQPTQDYIYDKFVTPVLERKSMTQDGLEKIQAYLRESDQHVHEASTSPRRLLLEQAAKIIDGDRNDTYGGPEKSFQTIARLWNEYLRVVTTVPGDAIQPHDVAAMLALLKIARIAGSGGTHKDSWVDLAGYAACGWETVEKQT